jgi:hypothetical protein
MQSTEITGISRSPGYLTIQTMTKGTIEIEPFVQTINYVSKKEDQK